MKTPMSRFHIHDELTAPEGSVPVLRGALASGGQLPNFLGVLAGSPAALRAYARFRSELRHGTLTLPTLERIALAVAQHYHSEPGNQMHSRTARQAGLALDEVALAKEWDSRDEREATLLRYLRSLVETQSQPPMHLHEEAREAGWTDEQILEAIAATAMETFTAMVNVAGEVPVDGSWEDSRRLRAARPPSCRGATLLRDEPRGSGNRRRGPRVTGHGRGHSAGLLSLLPRGGRAHRPPVDGRDRRGPHGRWPAALQRDLPRRARAQRPPAVRAHEGARGPRRRDAARGPRPAGQGPLRAHRHGPVPRAGAPGAQVVGPPVAARRDPARGAQAVAPTRPRAHPTARPPDRARPPV